MICKDLLSLLNGVAPQQIIAPEGCKLEEVSVTAVSSDSRKCEESSLFVALTGLHCDGHAFISSAVKGGSGVVVVNRGRLHPPELAKLLGAGVVVIEVENSATAYGAIAANAYDRPADQLVCIGISGTNGKTTVSYLAEHVLLGAGLSVGVIGTVNNRYTDSSGTQIKLASNLTTPEPLSLQRTLREMVDHGVSHVIMEVSSHALAQSRVDTISFELAAFTNLSRDHLDYHRDMDDYFQAKMRLFSHHLAPGGIAVLPEIDDGEEHSDRVQSLHQHCKESGQRMVVWGRGQGAAVRLIGSSQTLLQTELEILDENILHTITSPLVGSFNVENILNAFALCRAAGIAAGLVCSGLSSATGAPGRMERVATGALWPSSAPTVFVDYAHTPDALLKVLSTARELPHTNLYVVFGCGGERDGGKRPLMGAIATRFSDVAIITDDNPRKEDPDTIVKQILAGALEQGAQPRDRAWLSIREENEGGCLIIRDRHEAIFSAIHSGGQGDIVVIAGKGHEPYQLTGEGPRYFDDCGQAKQALFSWTNRLVARATKGTLQPGSTAPGPLGTISTDSREKTRDGIFVALKGDNHDGHDHAPQAVANGSRCLVLEKENTGIDSRVSQVIVADCTRALGDLAAFRRKAIAGSAEQIVIGLTGSCGKTTVKEMIGAILKKHWQKDIRYPEDPVLLTRGNFNNLVGLPLSLLPLTVEHRAAVLEMGMNSRGEIGRLAEIADPDISCITNIHGAHLEGLGSIDGVVQAKEELFAESRKEATLIVNLDDQRIRTLALKYRQKKITFGVNGDDRLPDYPAPDLWASGIRLEASGITRFTLHYKEQQVEVQLAIAGEHNVANGLCAAAVAIAAGVSLEDITNGLADFRPPDKRMEMLKAAGGFGIINDSYNANPASMAAGLKTLKQMGRGKTVAILGDMLELGAASSRAHYELGRLVAELGIDGLAAVGEFKDRVVEGALDHGMDHTRAQPFASKEELINWMQNRVADEQLGSEDLVLVKASRGLRFETIVAQLVE